MDNYTPWKYLSILTLPALVVLALLSKGVLTWLPVVYIFGFIPLLELFLQPNKANHAPEEEKLLLASPIYDWLLYLTLPIQYGVLLFFLLTIDEPGLEFWEVGGRIVSMGLMCGVLGINVAHELGHRVKPLEQNGAKALLLTSLYMHFYIEHNRGHHKRVSTPEDPATSRYGEVLYSFWIRSAVGGYLSAWELEHKRLRRQGLPIFSLKNEMLRFQLIQLGLLVLIAVVFGLGVMLAFVGAAVVGFLLLETVNYIEHYGLSRKPLANGFERVQPWHSWNSDHLIGRVLLFELSRHSDHHFKASRKYQILRHHEDSPQMPTGYPGMMVLSMIPPLWFWVMHRRIARNNVAQ